MNARNPFKTWSVVLGSVAGLVALTAVAVALFSSVALRRMAAPLQSEIKARAERLLPTYLALGSAVAADPFYSAKRPGPDAGPWLNPRLPWEPGPEPSARELILPQALVAQLKGWGDTWPEHAEDIDWAAVDVTWMRRLERYGFWSLLPGGPLDVLQEPRWASIPLPRFDFLQQWAKLRFLAARRNGDWLDASREVRHLAWLCHSTECHLGAMVALAILKIERRAHSAAAATGAAGPWMPSSEEWLEDARAVAFSAPAFAFPSLDSALLEKAKAIRAFRCHGLTNNASFLLLRRRAGIAIDPGLEREVSHPEPPCRLEMVRWYLEKGTDLTAELAPRWLQAAQKLIPGAAGEFLASIAEPDWCKRLEQREAALKGAKASGRGGATERPRGAIPSSGAPQ